MSSPFVRCGTTVSSAGPPVSNCAPHKEYIPSSYGDKRYEDPSYVPPDEKCVNYPTVTSRTTFAVPTSHERRNPFGSFSDGFEPLSKVSVEDTLTTPRLDMSPQELADTMETWRKCIRGLVKNKERSEKDSADTIKRLKKSMKKNEKKFRKMESSFEKMWYLVKDTMHSDSDDD